MTRRKASSQTAQLVSVGSVKIRVRPWKHPSGRDYWRATYVDGNGETKDITRAEKSDAVREANRVAREIHNGMTDLSELSQEKLRMVRAFLDLNPTWADLERWGAERKKPTITTVEIIDMFHSYRLKEKEGVETKWMQTQHNDLLTMAFEVGEETMFQHVRASALAEWLDDLDVGAKRRKDYRAACVQLWKWARKQELIVVSGEYTEPEKLPVPEVKKADYVRVLSVEELTFLFKHVRKAFLPWLALSAFSGLRSGEIRQAGKDPLDWSMIKLDRLKIDLPPSISKTGKRKLIPISPTLAAWLKVCKPPAAGPVIPEPAYREETLRLGKLMDERFGRDEGWPINCLRHSFGSHMVAKTSNIAAVSLEMGNSPKVVQDHYLEVRTKEEARAYFRVLPGTIGEHFHK